LAPLSVEALRKATGGGRDKTQIHGHMCYSERGDIPEAISTMNAERMELEKVS